LFTKKNYFIIFFIFSLFYFPSQIKKREQNPQTSAVEQLMPSTLIPFAPTPIPKPVAIPNLPKAPERTEPEAAVSNEQTNLPSPLRDRKKTIPDKDVAEVLRRDDRIIN